MYLVLFVIAAADLTGIWTGQMPGRKDDKIDVAFQFKQNGAAVTGKIYGDYKSTPIVEGKVSGDSVTFFVIAEEQSGNQINDSRLKFTGTLRDGALELTRERESSTNAGNGGAVKTQATPTSFRLKKLL